MSRPVCTCGPGENHCPAEVWWQTEGRYQVARALHIRSWDREAGSKDVSPHPSYFSPTDRRRGGGKSVVTQEVFEQDMQAWIQRTGRLPTINDFDYDSGLHHSSRWIYRYYGTLPGFWRYAVEQGWATEQMRLERVRAMKERPRRRRPQVQA